VSHASTHTTQAPEKPTPPPAKANTLLQPHELISVTHLFSNAVALGFINDCSADEVSQSAGEVHGLALTRPAHTLFQRQKKFRSSPQEKSTEQCFTRDEKNNFKKIK